MHVLQEDLIGYANWLGYGHGERAKAWVKRLEANYPELVYFKGQPVPSCPAYLPLPANLEQINDSLKTVPVPASIDAATAFHRAKQHPELRIFTSVVQHVPTPQSGYLKGMPIAVKDLMAVAGIPLSGGSTPLDNAPQRHNAEVVARLRHHGAAIIGTTNLHELAYGITSDNPHFGRVVNPVARDRTPGGSSGGSAAAIAAGIVPGAIGTDTAGSIRVPAACCGVTGFKPSYDVLPRAGVMDLAPSLDHVGPLGRTVEDCAALFAAMLDCPAIPAWRYESLADRRFAKLAGYFEEPLDGEVRRALQEAIEALAQDGALCSVAAIENMEAASSIQFNTICAEASAIHASRLVECGHRLGEDVRVRLEIGHFLPGHWYVKAQRMRQQLAVSFDALFEKVDFLICPTMRTPAPLAGATKVMIEGQSYPLHTAVTHLTLPFNLTGLPAISIPWNLTHDGVPIGLQIVGRRGADWQVLAAAERLERYSPWHAIEHATNNKKESYVSN